jgi:predicted sulfurtransferase
MKSFIIYKTRRNGQKLGYEDTHTHTGEQNMAFCFGGVRIENVVVRLKQKGMNLLYLLNTTINQIS